MPAKPAISVLMPAYNAEATVDEAVESILQQTETSFEYIVVDDGSTDATRERLQAWAGTDSRIRLISTPHKGIVHALNLGLQHAGGAYIARMDADDRSLPQRLELQRRYLDAHPDVGLVSCLVEHLGDKQQKSGYARYVNWINFLANYDDISLNRFVESPLAHPSVMFRTDLINRYGDYRQGDFPEDYELWLRWLEHDVCMEKLSEMLLQWRDRPERLSRTHERYSFEAFYRVKGAYLAKWLKRCNAHHPDVVVWGAGRTSRKRAEMLTRHGINISAYVDVDPNKIGRSIRGRLVLSPEKIPERGRCFVVSYVGSHGARVRIRRHLLNRGYAEGKHFILAS